MGLVMGLAVTGCGGDKKSPSASPESPSSSPSASESDKPAEDPGFGVAKVGQCFRMTAVQSRASVAAPARVNCRRPHTTQVAYVGYVTKPITAVTPVAERRAAAKKVCEPAFRAVVGGTLADRAQSLLTWTFFTPGQSQLEHGARWVRCDVLAPSDGGLVPLPTTSPLLSGGVPEQLRVCTTQQATDVSCARPHAYRVAAVFRAPGSTYPGVSTVVARTRCHDLTQAFGGFFQLPSRDGWATGDRFVRCLTAASTPSPSPSPTP